MRALAFALSLFIGCSTLIACGGGGLGLGDPGQDGGPSDPGDCKDVCFTWLAPGPPETPTPPAFEQAQTRCNQDGVASGQCPSGTTCGAPEREVFSDYALTRPLCNASGDLSLTLDLPAPPHGSRLVTIRLFEGGAPWPARDPLQGSPGKLRISDATHTWLVGLPGDASSTIPLQLDPGDYQVTLDTQPDDPTRYAQTARTGKLTVGKGGIVDLDFPALRLTFAASIDGAPFPTVSTSEFVDVAFTSAHGLTTFVQFRGGQQVAGSLFLEPDRYTVDVSVFAGPTSTLVSGAMRVFDDLDLSASRTLELPLVTDTVSASITVDGEVVDPASGGRLMLLDAATRTFTDRPINGTPTLLRVYRGTYDIGLQPDRSGNGAYVRRGWSSGPLLMIAARTVALSGSLLLNGAAPQPAQGVRGSIVLSQGPYLQEFVSISGAGAATFQGTVLEGDYQVQLWGFTDDLPRFHVFDRPWTASTSPLALGLDAHQVDLTLTLEGAALPDADGPTRGQVVLVRNHPYATDLTYFPTVELGVAGPAHGSVTVEDGDWEVAYIQYRQNNPALPQGATVLGKITVAGPVTTAFNLHLAHLTGTVTRDGADLPTSATGTRGYVSFGDGLFGRSVELPANGPAAFDVRVYAGTLDVSFDCPDWLRCDEAAIAPSSWLVTGLHLPAF
ncbi:MAG: hypothetical protein JST92_19905 [Deltaproteobacteria bacterium]|nr:hypothetical protein [Deltaproteobacteria bacterium]